MSQPINGSFGLAMFRKKRMPTKPGYKLVTIKRGGDLLREPSLLWGSIFISHPTDELEIADGPIIPIIISQYDRGEKTFVDYVSEHADVAVWIPEQYLSSLAPGVA